MKNLIPYTGDCFGIHKNAVDRKNRGDIKTRLLKLNSIIEIEFKKFDKKFRDNKLFSLVPNLVLTQAKDDLLTLYDYQSSVISMLRENIRKLQMNTIISTCQNCTIDSVNTLDHILPKAKYPEFVVNPKNLFPCCSTCNSYKLDSMGNLLSNKFLNLYLDPLPKEQYLFVDIFLDANMEMDFYFYLKNVKNRIDLNLFSTIENHYRNLHLFDRMKFKSTEYISELENKIRSFRASLKVKEITTILIAAINEDKAAYGDNHWKCIFELAFIQSPIFMDRFK